ncbi:MAG: O-antigen ligase family protein [Planctomyces sp.]
MTVWAGIIAAFVVLWLVLWLRHGPSVALCIVVPLTFLIPVWVSITVYGIPLQVRSLVAFFAICGYAIHPQGKLFDSLTALDVCVGAMCLIQIVSDFLVEGFQLQIPAISYGEWVLPYVVGRYAVGDELNLRMTSVCVLAVVFLLGLAGVVESLSGTNVFESVFGERPFEGFSRDASRLGFKRAYGTLLHPIFFGIFLLTLLPWCVPYLTAKVSIHWRIIGGLSLVVGIAGVLSTISRGPAVGVLVFAAVLSIIRWRFLRLPAFVVSTALVVLFVSRPDLLIRMADLSVGEERGRLVELDGSLSHLTSSSNRFLLFRVYQKAALNSGLFGYGSEATSKFPPNVPYLPSMTSAVKNLPYVDNAWLLFTLRLGFLGVIGYSALFITGVITASRTKLATSETPLMAAFAAGLTASAFALQTVWMNYDCGSVILWTLGIVSGTVISQRSA